MGKIKTLAHVSALAMIAGATQAGAQTSRPAAAETQDSDTIVVTARKRDESIQDVPLSTIAVSGAALKTLGVRDSSDLLQLVPGATFINNGSQNRNEITIRGAGTGRLANSESGNGLYRDGAFVGGGSFGGRSFSRMDLFDVERIEVLRGPQGALYGRNAVGGAVNIITTKPAFDFEGRVGVGYGRNELFEASGVVNVPIIDDVLAVRIGGIYANQAQGFYLNTRTAQNPVVPVNLQPGQYGDASRFTGFKGAIRFKPTSDFDMTVFVDHYNDNGPDSNLKQYDVTGGTAGSFNQIKPAEDPYLRNRDSIDRTVITETNVNMTIKWSLPFATLATTTNYKQRVGTRNNDLDATQLSLYSAPPQPNLSPIYGVFTGDFSQISQEVRLSSPNPTSPLQWTVGGDYVHYNDLIVNRTFADLSVTNALLASPTAAIRTLGRNLLGAFINDNTPVSADSWAVFASLEYKLFDALVLNGEVRYTKDVKRINSTRQRGDGTTIPFQTTFFNTRLQTEEVTPAATIKYNFNRNFLVYGRYATAFRPSGFNFDRGTFTTIPNPSPETYNPEKSNAFEIGAKTSWDKGRFVANLALYQQNYTGLLLNLVARDQSAFPVNVNYLVNAGEARVQGAELELRANLPVVRGDKLTVSGTFSTQDGTITASTVPTVLVGSKPTFLRDFQANVALDYSHKFNDDIGFSIGGSVSGGYGGISSPANQVPRNDEETVNLRTALTYKNVTARFEVKNLFNQQVDVIRQSSPLDRGNVRNQPLTWRFDLEYKF